MQLPAAVYHEKCRKSHALFHARELIAVGVGVYMGWVRCAGVTLHVYDSKVRAATGEIS